MIILLIDVSVEMEMSLDTYAEFFLKLLIHIKLSQKTDDKLLTLRTTIALNFWVNWILYELINKLSNIICCK